MAENTKIEWAHHTFNCWRGCTKKSPGCDACYAEALSRRNPATLGVWGKFGTRVIAAESYWKEPLKWDRIAGELGERHRVFCGSLMDVFEGNDTMPQASRQPVLEARKRLFHLIYNTPNLDWLLVTKRPELVTTIMEGVGCFNGLADFKNVWFIVSVEDQKRADERIPILLNIKAAIRGLSIEPLLGKIGLGEYLAPSAMQRCIPHHQRTHHEISGIGKFAGCEVCNAEWTDGEIGIDWVIVGGESGPKARPFNIEWARSIIQQCKAAGVPVFMKQLGSDPYFSTLSSDILSPNGTEWTGHGMATARPILKDRKGGDPSEWPEDLRIREFPKEQTNE